MNTNKIVVMTTGFVLAVAVATSSQAAPPDTNECPGNSVLVHVSGPQNDPSRDADRNEDGWVCEQETGGGDVKFKDNNKRPKD